MNTLLIFFSSVRWQDVVDIALVSYILFRLYILLRETHAHRVLIGIALLWLFQRMAVFFGFIITSWVVQGIIAVAALIIIVVFRNEIRSILQAKNLGAMLWRFPRKEIQVPVEIVTDSVFEMARSHTGALIVLPGKEDLTEFLQNGITWGGSLSKEMLLSIFWHNGPVHDGAAIIRGDQVAEVGALLPLSHRKDLPPHYGTRHRAAAGLAETTDALVIVVSEEKGRVAVAKGPLIERVRGPHDLIEKLRAHVGVPSKGLGAQTRMKLEIGAAAVASLLFVSGAWFSITRGMDTLVTLEAPIEFMNRNPETEILETSINKVRLDLAGSRVLANAVRLEQIHVRIDLGGAVIGRNIFTISPENVILPPGIFLRDVEPSAIEVTVDRTQKKVLPVQVDWVGTLPEHIIITEAKLNPKTIEVIGAKTILDDTATIYTEKTKVDNITQSGSIDLKLALRPPSLKIAPGSQERVAVTYTVKDQTH